MDDPNCGTKQDDSAENPQLESPDLTQHLPGSLADEISQEPDDNRPRHSPGEIQHEIADRADSARSQDEGRHNPDPVNETKSQDQEDLVLSEQMKDASGPGLPTGSRFDKFDSLMSSDVKIELVAEKGPGKSDEEHKWKLQIPLVGRESTQDQDRFSFQKRPEEYRHVPVTGNQMFKAHALI